MLSRASLTKFISVRCSHTRSITEKSSLPPRNWNLPVSNSRRSKPGSSSGLRKGDVRVLPDGEHAFDHQPTRRAPTPKEYAAHRRTMKEQFPDGWNPPRKVSREAMDGLRALHRHDPVTFSTPVLAERFKISAEAVRRILKSKWIPSKEEEAKLLDRERRRKKEAIMSSIAKERQDKWDRIDRREQEAEDKLSFR